MKTKSPQETKPGKGSLAAARLLHSLCARLEAPVYRHVFPRARLGIREHVHRSQSNGHSSFKTTKTSNRILSARAEDPAPATRHSRDSRSGPKRWNWNWVGQSGQHVEVKALASLGSSLSLRLSLPLQSCSSLRLKLKEGRKACLECRVPATHR